MELREFRTIHVRTAEDGEWLVEGIAVPWDETYDTGYGFRERFERGSFAAGDGVGQPIYAEHGHLRGDLPIGSIVAAEDHDEGRFVRARISHTVRGEEAHTLLRDGVLRKFSIGFEDLAHRVEEDGTIVRTSAQTREVSLTGNPAYQNADVTGVRHSQHQSDPHHHQESTVPDTTAEDLAELRSTNEDLTRRLAVIEAGGDHQGGEALPYRSMAEFVRALADGSGRQHVERMNELVTDAADRTATRAYTGAVTAADTSNAVPTWIDREIKLVDKGRRILNLFSRAPLPAEGMTINYPKFGSTQGGAARQANQGDDLNYIALKITTASANIETYGGYSSLSRQAIERASTAYLSKVLDYQKISYGKVTNGAVRSILTTGSTGAITGQNIAANNTVAAAWVDAVVDALARIDEDSTALQGEFMLMGLHHFRTLVGITDSTGRPVFDVNGDGANTYGDATLARTIPGLRANIAGLPVVVDASLTGTTAYVCSSDAITVMENAGAPLRLQDENVINLTRDFSLYGYMALTLNDPKGIVKITASTAAPAGQ